MLFDCRVTLCSGFYCSCTDSIPKLINDLFKLGLVTFEYLLKIFMIMLLIYEVNNIMIYFYSYPMRLFHCDRSQEFSLLIIWLLAITLRCYVGTKSIVLKCKKCFTVQEHFCPQLDYLNGPVEPEIVRFSTQKMHCLSFSMTDALQWGSRCLEYVVKQKLNFNKSSIKFITNN